MAEIIYECCRDCRLLDICIPNYNGEPPCFQKVKESAPIPVETPENIQKTITTLKEWIMEEEKTYRIVRKYKYSHPDNNKEIATGLTLEEARAHCKDPDSKEDGVWFDCFYEE